MYVPGQRTMYGCVGCNLGARRYNLIEGLKRHSNIKIVSNVEFEFGRLSSTSTGSE